MTKKKESQVDLDLDRVNDLNETTVKFKVGGEEYFAVVRSLATPEAKKTQRLYHAAREKYKVELKAGKSKDANEFGLDIDDEVSNETNDKIESFYSKGLIKETNFDKINDALMSSPELRSVINVASFKLFEDFISQKKS